MPKKYAIWDKTSPVITPVGEVFTAEEWTAKHPAAAIESVKIVCGAGEVNGAYFGMLGQMVQMYTSMGADFSKAKTDNAKLEVIEAFEDSMSAQSEESSPEERIAAALELANVMKMPTVNEDDPDAE